MWPGQIEFRAKIGVPARVGRFAVPKAVTMTLTGDDGEPSLRVEYAIRDERPECREVHVIAGTGGRALRTADLDWLMLDKLAAAAFERFAQTVVRWDEQEIQTTSPVQQTDLADLRHDIDDSLAARPVPAQQLEQVARVYADNRAGGAPLKAVEVHLGLKRRTAARRVEAARARGLLTSTGDFIPPPATVPLTAEQAARVSRENAAIIELIRENRGAITPEIRKRLRNNSGSEPTEVVSDGKRD